MLISPGPRDGRRGDAPRMPLRQWS